MSQRMRYFILLMLINLVVVVIYLIFENLRRKEKYASNMDEGRNDASLSGGMVRCSYQAPFYYISFLLRREWIFQMWYLARSGQIPLNVLMRK